MLAYGTVLLHLVRREDVSECMNIFINVTYLYTLATVLSVFWLARATAFARACMCVATGGPVPVGARARAGSACVPALEGAKFARTRAVVAAISVDRLALCCYERDFA